MDPILEYANLEVWILKVKKKENDQDFVRNPFLRVKNSKKSKESKKSKKSKNPKIQISKKSKKSKKIQKSKGSKGDPKGQRRPEGP